MTSWVSIFFLSFRSFRSSNPVIPKISSVRDLSLAEEFLSPPPVHNYGVSEILHRHNRFPRGLWNGRSDFRAEGWNVPPVSPEFHAYIKGPFDLVDALKILKLRRSLLHLTGAAKVLHFAVRAPVAAAGHPSDRRRHRSIASAELGQAVEPVVISSILKITRVKSQGTLLFKPIYSRISVEWRIFFLKFLDPLFISAPEYGCFPSSFSARPVLKNR